MVEQGSLRDYIEQIISENPGIHFREIQRKSGAAVGQVEYHLYQLEKMEKISIRKDGKLKRYFLLDNTGFSERKIIYFLRNRYAKDVIFYLLEHDNVELSYFLTGRKGRQENMRQIISDMIEQEVLHSESRSSSSHLFLSDPDKTKLVLKRFRESFLDSMSTNIMSMLD